MKSFTRMHVIFAAFFVLAVLTSFGLMGWLGHLHENGPDEFFKWQPIILPICTCLLVGVPLMWFLFAIYHLAAVLRKRAKHEH